MAQMIFLRKFRSFQLLSTVAGVAVVCTVAMMQHLYVLNTGMELQKFILPALVGGGAGLLFGIWFGRMRIANAALQESEARYRDLFENANDLVQSISPEGDILFANRAWRQTLGYSEEDLSSLNISRIIHPGCIDRCMKTFQELMSGQTHDRLEATFITKDGEKVIVEGSVNCNFINGRPVASRGIFRNITGRKRAEEALRASEERYRSLVENIELGIALVDTDYRVVMANPSLKAMVGRADEDLVGRRCFELFFPGRESCPDCPGKRAMESGQPSVGEFDVVLRDGKSMVVRVQASPVYDSGGVVAGFIEVAEDITARRQAEEEVRRSSEFSQTVLNSMNDAVSIIDVTDFRIVGVNRVFLEELGLTEEEAIGRTCHEVTHGLSVPCGGCDHLCPLTSTAATGRYFVTEHVHKDKRGGTRFVEVSTSPIRDGAGKVVQVVHASRDITDRKKAEQEIEQLAYYDTLTGLPNRALLRDRLVQALAQAHRQHTHVGVLFLDLDRFKTINDTLGHATGDTLLQTVAGRLLQCVRESDTVSRLGGDEFVMIIPGVTRGPLLSALGQKILDGVCRPINLNGHEIVSTVSIGIAVYPGDGQDVDALLMNADTAMYAAKESGRNCIQFYSGEMNRQAVERLDMETNLRRALAQEEFSLHYQPQLDLGTGRVIGVEALLRWQHPHRGNIPPGRFISLAEETGLILPIGNWVMRTACAQLKQWHEAGFPDLKVAVNLSGRQFKQRDFIDEVDRVLAETGLDPKTLEFELTESILMETAERNIEILTDLKVRGIQVSIDDFGTGYSSLSYLKNFPIDRIKVAQEFVQNITRDEDVAAIVEAILVMGRSLKMKLIAEGVETREQLEFLTARECDEMQGNYFGKPMPPDEFFNCLTEGLMVEGICPYRA